MVTEKTSIYLNQKLPANGLHEYEFSGQFETNKMSFEAPKDWGRGETIVNKMKMFAIEKANTSFESTYSGYVGIAPNFGE